MQYRAESMCSAHSTSFPLICSLICGGHVNHQEFKVYSYFRQMWKDSRLAGKLNSTFTIKGGEIDNIWVPDPFCYNARETNMVMPNEEIHNFVHIQPNGDITYSKG